MKKRQIKRAGLAAQISHHAHGHRSGALPQALTDQCQSSPHRRRGDRGDADAHADPPRKYLTGSQVCARYGISDMSLWRWLRDPKVAFPQPAMRIRDRRFWLEADLIAWERSKLPRGDEAAA